MLSKLRALYRLFPPGLRELVRSGVRVVAPRSAERLFSAYGASPPDNFYARFEPAAKPVDPPSAVWTSLLADLTARKGAAAPVLDVVIPVYQGFDETLACVYSVLATKNTTPHEIILIDDAAPDRALTQRLENLASAGVVTLIHNDSNRGFVATVNRGMKLHPARDVVLLNSDTEVYHDWIDRLRAAAYADPATASVTPFSSNGGLCSYPYFNHDNYMDIGSYELIDSLVRASAPGRTIDIPTAVGFCMYIRRDAIERVGYFDEEAFGRGYGEENDFCLRAVAAGLNNVMAVDTYVRHLGATSFGADKPKRVTAAGVIIDTKYPDYQAAVDSFIERDPVLPYRRSIDAARMRNALPHQRTMLHILHVAGGGIEKHVRDLAGYLEASGWNSVLLSPDADTLMVRLTSNRLEHTPNLCYTLIDARGELVDVLRLLDVTHVHVHTLMDFPPDAANNVMRLCTTLGVSYDITVHDYYWICPRVNLVDDTRVYCGEPTVSICETCVAGLLPEGATVASWRTIHGGFLGHARRHFVPDTDVAQRMGHYFPSLTFQTRPHPEPAILMQELTAERKPGKPLRIAIIGGITDVKGLALLWQCVVDATARRLPIHFVIIGYPWGDGADALWRAANVTITGRYENADLPELIRAHQCHLAWFSSVWPETYLYTLTGAVAAGLFPVAFDFGAAASRIRGYGWGQLVPVELMSEPAKVNDILLALTPTPRPASLKLTSADELYPDFVKSYYGLGP